MRGVCLVVALAFLAGCASEPIAEEPGPLGIDDGGPSDGPPVEEVTFFESEYQVQFDPLTFEVAVPPAAVDVRFEIWQNTNVATARATLSLSGCGSGTADWTAPTNIIIGVGRSMQRGDLCETAEGGTQTLTIDPETTPMEGTVRLIGVPTLA